MAKAKTRYTCSGCGHVSLAWTGQCPGCKEWNTLEESIEAPARAAARRSVGGTARAPKPVALRDVKAPNFARLRTGVGELDRVLGGGLVPGSLVLLGGSPGIGKSTLTGMALANLQAAGASTLYVSGEESAAQVRLRAERLGEDALSVPVIAEASLGPVLAALEAERPQVCVVDSIQTMQGEEGVAGSVSQIREAAAGLTEVAKRLDIAVILVGHVTKDGNIAGPRVLEHLVDCVLRFDGERERAYRTLRASKNRFGATSEVGVFEMRAGGLTEVADPSARFVEDATKAPGSVILAAMEGTRPVLVEVQALVAPSELENPRRMANGVDRNRLSLVLAVLTRHAGVSLASSDVFVNVAGGVRVDEPGADLAVALAVASAQRGEPLLASSGKPLACFGELGLTGELRYVGHPDRRAEEARKFGLEEIVGPPAQERLRGVTSHATVRSAVRAGLGGGSTLRSAA